MTHADASRGRSRPSVAKLPRLLELVAMLQGGPARHSHELARELGVSSRSIKRYIQTLMDAKIPVYHDREHGGYRIRRDYYLKPVDLALTEAVSLALLCEHLGTRRGIPNLSDAGRALSKIESALPSVLRSEVRALASRIGIHPARSEYDGDSSAHYGTVREAIRTGTVLRAQYEAARPGAGTEEFEFSPYALFFNQRAWYAVGRHSGRRGLRSLKLVRFQRLEPLRKSFTTPASFSLERYLGNAWRMMRGEREYAVELCFDPHFAQGISETYWHRTQEFRHRDDGSLVMNFRVAGLDEIVWWVLGMGPHCRVIRPAALRDRVRELASRTSALYA